MAATNSESRSQQVGKLTVTYTERGAEFRRLIDAPRRLVWEAMSKAEHYPHWWGPAQYPMVSCELDFRSGGSYRFVTRGPEGEDVFRGEIREVVAPERVVQTFIWEGAPQAVMLDSLNLVEQGDQTLLTAHSILESGSLEDVEMMIQSGMAEGTAETYDRLEAYARTLG